MTETGVIEFTEQVASELAESYADVPLDELRVWMRMAHQREAMVTELYEVSHIVQRLQRCSASGPQAVARGAVTSIWAQEQSHTHFLGCLRGLTGSALDFTALQGRLEGVVVRSALSGDLFARALIAIGRSVGAIPEFARELRRMDLRELFRFHGDLEQTARAGYARMLTLHAQLSKSERHAFGEEVGYAFSFDVARIACEEEFHAEIFATLEGWVDRAGEDFEDARAERCIEALHGICGRNLAIDRVRSLAGVRSPVAKGEPEGWASAGGLEALFEDYGLSVPVPHVG